MLMLGVTLAAAAQNSPRVYRDGNSWVEETTGTLPAARNLRIDIESGSAKVQGGASGISYTVKKVVYKVSSEQEARREFDAYRVRADRSGDTAILAAEFPRHSGMHRFSAEFTVQAPRDLDLVRVETRGGSIGVSNISGRVESETAGGSVTLDNIGGVVQANTMGGSISLTSAATDAMLKSAGGAIAVDTVGGRLTATTYGGDLVVGSVKQNAYLDTAGGSITIRKAGGDLNASTAGGNIDAGDIGGSATLKTAGGNIRLVSARGPVSAATAGGGIALNKLWRGARAETAAGEITAAFAGDSASFTDSFLETTAGDIRVYLPSNLACRVRAAIEMASGHQIRTDFPVIKITSEGQYGPKQVYGEGVLNGGGPTLKLHTSIGDIEILKATK